MSRRQEQVDALLQQELGLLLQRRVQDPRVQGVHITSVLISPDLRVARVYFSTIDEHHDENAAKKGLDSAKPFLRRELAKVLKMRVVPELAFFFDPAIRHGDKMIGLLHKLVPGSSPSGLPVGDTRPTEDPPPPEPASPPPAKDK
jgi:ribosome-binding factor A